MKILHVVPGLDEPTNGIAVAAKLIADEQRKQGYEVDLVDTSVFLRQRLCTLPYVAVWVHSMWLPMTMIACFKVWKAHTSRFVRMLHGCLDPIKVRYSWWKKLSVAPVEWVLLKLADEVVVTEADEEGWVRRWLCGDKFSYFDLGSTVKYVPRVGLGRRKLVFVGRMHPLKGIEDLIEAMRNVCVDVELTIIGKDERGMRRKLETLATGLPIRFLGEVSSEIKRREMSEADCLILPTLSENFGLVVKESLELGVPVMVTNGASIWKGHKGVFYIDGYRESNMADRVEMLRRAIASFCRGEWL